jgi:hypothetical protein
MDQYKRKIITRIKGSKRSPASPASHACPRFDDRTSTVASSLLTRLQGNTPAPGARVLPCYLGAVKPRRPDPVTFGRLQSFLNVARRLLEQEFTTAWLARTLVRFDRGPLLDAPRLGLALRALGFRSMRRRQGTRRRSMWLVPGAPSPRVGRPKGRPVGSGARHSPRPKREPL